MSGIRIHHPTLRRAMLAVPSRRELADPKMCGRCGEAHRTKHYHVDLDSEGDAVVSETVWRRLQEIGTHPFLVLNEVPDPPALTVGLHRERQRDDRRHVKQVGDALRDLAPPGAKISIVRSR